MGKRRGGQEPPPVCYGSRDQAFPETPMLRKSIWAGGIALALLAVLAPAASAQAPDRPAQPPAAKGLAVPPAESLLIMIRTTLVALNHANWTGNYTVLRDLAAPAFRTANDPARLGQIFANLRSRNLDLSPVAIVTPKVSKPPAITPQGMLDITGVFPTRPLQINFQLLFQPVAGKWRLFGISVNPSPAPQTVAPTPPEKPKKSGQ